MSLDFTADQYADAVLSGDILACKWVRLACQRYQDDIATGAERGLHFDQAEAERAVKFFYHACRHWKGEWAGQPIYLEPWQQFIVWNVFGWKRADGTRRFRTAYIEVARKNGKTTLGAGMGLYMMVADNEPGAEIYTAATKRDQAKIAHEDAKQMVKRSPMLKKRIETLRDNLNSTANASKFEPLSADYNSLDGLNPHCAICDEVHAWPSGYLWGVLETGMGARRQPLMLGITTAGFDQDSYCLELRDYLTKILDGVVVDDSFFGVVYTLDDEDMTDEASNGRPWWEHDAAWVKANPNLQVSKKLEQMQRKAKQATNIASNWTQFITKELNVWTQGETKWINLDAWRQCGLIEFDEADLIGRECWAGLDLSSNTDVTALVYVFPMLDGVYAVLCRFFIPEDNMHDRVQRDRVPFDVWVRDGWVTATPGNVIDYDFILEQIAQDRERFDIRELAFDRWGAQRIQTQLMNKYGEDWVVQFGQGYASMSAPSKDLEKLILGHKLAHGNNPVLSWMASNVVVTIDAAENIKPNKEKSRERIDGVIGLIMGLARATAEGGPRSSVYNERGLRVMRWASGD